MAHTTTTKKKPAKTTTKKNNSVFEDLNSINLDKHKQKKGKFDYLPWSDAITYLLKKYPNATWKIHEFDYPITSSKQDEQGYYGGWVKYPYMKTDTGYYVKVSVTINDITRTEVMGVEDNLHRTIKQPNTFEVNKAIKRCLVKAIACFGLGLYIYRGEDLLDPDPKSAQQSKASKVKPKHTPLSTEQKENIKALISDSADDFQNMIIQSIEAKKICQENYDDYVSQFTQLNKSKEDNNVSS